MKTQKFLKSIFLLLVLTNQLNAQAIKLNSKLKKYANNRISEFSIIPADRQEILKKAGDYIIKQSIKSQPVKILFICTHNSRRSQMGQAWAETASIYYGIDSVTHFSGGTESTAFNERAIKALKRAGFRITGIASDKNPRYLLSIASNKSPLVMFSKKYTDIQNPQNGILALMVCSEADKSCPFVSGADIRISLPFEDPKHYDNTPAESKQYEETCKLIAREMFFMYSYVKKQIIVQAESSK